MLLVSSSKEIHNPFHIQPSAHSSQSLHVSLTESLTQIHHAISLLPALDTLFIFPSLTCWTPIDPSKPGSRLPFFGKSFLSRPSTHFSALLTFSKQLFRLPVHHFIAVWRWSLYPTCQSAPHSSAGVSLSCRRPRNRIKASDWPVCVPDSALPVSPKQTLSQSPRELEKYRKLRWQELTFNKLLLLDKIFS